MPQPNADTVGAFYASYLAQDRAAAERLVAEEFVFTSPQDDHIDRAAFFDRCFPTADRFKEPSRRPPGPGAAGSSAAGRRRWTRSC
jgi:ketosteroid isomerase-like protein